MMDGRTFNAREMREMAGSIEYERAVTYFPDVFKIAQMLRQAADVMDREKKYEYSAKYASGFVSGLHSSTIGGTDYAKGRKDYVGVVRREVGEWEEVRDGD